MLFVIVTMVMKISIVNIFFSRLDGPCSHSVSQSVSEVCLYVTPIRFEVLSEPMKLQFIKGK